MSPMSDKRYIETKCRDGEIYEHKESLEMDAVHGIGSLR